MIEALDVLTFGINVATAIDRTQEEALGAAQADYLVFALHNFFKYSVVRYGSELFSATNEEGMPVARGEALAFFPFYSLEAAFTLQKLAANHGGAR